VQAAGGAALTDHGPSPADDAGTGAAGAAADHAAGPDPAAAPADEAPHAPGGTETPGTEAPGTEAPGTETPGGAESGPAEAPPRRIGLFVAIALAVLALDIVTKAIVVATLSDRPATRLLGGLLYLTEARNAGAAFAFAQGATILFTAIAVLVVVVILRTASQLRSLPWAVSLGLILGGATGNLVDRLFRSPGPLRGRVVDWISVFDPFGRTFPIFNIADSGITIGGILAVLLALTGREFTGARTQSRAERAKAGGPVTDRTNAAGVGKPGSATPGRS
jgi:signal peptidase II